MSIQWIKDRFYERQHWYWRLRHAILGNEVARRERRWERQAMSRLHEAGFSDSEIARARAAWHKSGTLLHWLAHAPIRDVVDDTRILIED